MEGRKCLITLVELLRLWRDQSLAILAVGDEWAEAGTAKGLTLRGMDKYHPLPDVA